MVQVLVPDNWQISASGQKSHNRFRAYHRQDRRNPAIGKLARERTARSVIDQTAGVSGINDRSSVRETVRPAARFAQTAYMESAPPLVE
jgi:hypothetical protein